MQVRPGVTNRRGQVTIAQMNGVIASNSTGKQTL